MSESMPPVVCQPRTAQAALLLQLYQAALAAVAPARCLPPHLPPPPRGRTVVIGAGKAAAAMAHAVEQHWHGPLSGLVVTRYGHGTACSRIEVLEAGHPLPDAAGLAAAGRMRAALHGLGPQDLVLCLISGGGSALLSEPAPGLTLDDKRALSRALLASGASIAEMNCVRKHLSAIKGGRLAQACRGVPLLTLAISDVPGDDAATIASGPTLADANTRHDAVEILTRYGIAAPPAVLRHLSEPASETPKPGDPVFAPGRCVVVARAQDALQAAAAAARTRGFSALVLGDDLEGEAREVAKVHAAIARQCVRHGEPARSPCVLLSGGETTVSLGAPAPTGARGGRNSEFLLALGLALSGHPAVHALAADSDGIDGSEDNAGALLYPDSLARARRLGLDPRALLAQHASYDFFAALDDLLLTGPSRTNVNDWRGMVIGG